MAIAEWEDAVQDVADTLGLEVDALGLAPMPKADYITLPIPSTSKIDFVHPSSADGNVPPPPPPIEEAEVATQAEEVEEEAATTGSKRKTRGSTAAATKGKGKKGKNTKSNTKEVEDEEMSSEPASKAPRTNEGNQSASGVGKIFSVLGPEHYKQPELPDVQELEAYLVARQKEELLKEYV